MTDCFFCTAPQSDERAEFAERCKAAWQQTSVRLHIVTPEVVGCSLEAFNRERRIYAEMEAVNGDYILTDDDCLIGEDFDGQRGIELLEHHPQFAILSALPKNATINLWTPERYLTFSGVEIFEHVSVGGIRFMRVGSHWLWPQSEGRGYDGTQGNYLRSSGFRVGYLRDLTYEHLGEGKSELWTSPALSVTN